MDGSHCVLMTPHTADSPGLLVQILSVQSSHLGGVVCVLELELSIKHLHTYVYIYICMCEYCIVREGRGDCICCASVLCRRVHRTAPHRTASHRITSPNDDHGVLVVRSEVQRIRMPVPPALLERQERRCAQGTPKLHKVSAIRSRCL